MNCLTLQDQPLRVAYDDPAACIRLADRLTSYLNRMPPGKRLAVVCIGTDRSTGDALGPLAGHILSKFHSSAFDLYGTLENPVHAMNLNETLERIRKEIRDPYIIGIDACLGKPDSIGIIRLAEGPILPGSGVHKELPPVGDIHMAAVVNAGGSMEYLVLQSTRLQLVMRMAHLIAHSLMIAVGRQLLA